MGVPGRCRRAPDRQGWAMSSADVLLTCEGAALTFGRGTTAVVAVHGADLTIRRGDRLAVVGPSGSGQSSLLHLLAGLERPTSGSISRPGLDGPRGVGLVFQADSLIPALDVAENTALPLVLAGRSPAQARRPVAEALALVGAADLVDRLP